MYACTHDCIVEMHESTLNAPPSIDAQATIDVMAHARLRQLIMRRMYARKLSKTPPGRFTP